MNTSTTNVTSPHSTDRVSMDYPSLEMVEEPFQVGLVTLFSLTAFLSLGGNVTVIVVLSMGKRSSGDLRAYLINLAVSDVAMAVFSIPFSYTLFMLGRWIFAPWFCPVVHAMQHTSVIVSVYTLVAIGIDRYRAIWYPLDRYSRHFRNKVIIIAVIWVMAGTVSASQLTIVKSKPFKWDHRWHNDCEEKWQDPSHGMIYTVFIFMFTFLIPQLGLALTYSSIAWKMWRRASPGNADTARDLVQLRAKRKVIKMLVTIVILFSLCWLPLQIFNAIYNFYPEFANHNSDTGRTVYAFAYMASLWLANANGCINPLIYCFMSENFRADLRDMLWSLCGLGSRRQYYSGSLRSSTRTTICLQNSSDFSKSFRKPRYQRSARNTSCKTYDDGVNSTLL